MIRNIQLRHAGKYTCAVQTKVDSVSIATDVVVRGKYECFSWLHNVNSRMGTKLLWGYVQQTGHSQTMCVMSI